MSESESLYKSNDSVIQLNDSKFVGTKMKVSKDVFQGPGLLKIYAPWCPHCISKVDDMNRLAKILPQEGAQVYVINAEKNQIFSRFFNIEGYPSFAYVNQNKMVEPLTNSDGEPVYDTQSVIKALCDHHNKCISN